MIHDHTRKFPESAAMLAVFLFSLFFFTISLGKSPFSSHGEAREALVVKNMIEQDSFTLPLRNGVEIPSKPPGFHWLAALSAYSFGSLNEFTARLPSAFSAALLLTLFFWFLGAEKVVREVQFAATAILATSFEFVRSASLARVDMVFSLFLFAAFVLLYRMFSAWPNKKPAMGISISLALILSYATLTKGPAGLILPWASAGLFLLVVAYRARRLSLPWASAMVSGLIVAMVAGAWYVSAYQVGGAQFLDVQIMRENVARLGAAEGYEIGHEKPFYVASIELLVAFLPWSLFLPHAAISLWRARSREDRLIEYSLSWVVVFFFALSLAASKRPVYWLPVLPATAFLTARGMFQSSRLRLATFFIFALTFSLAAIAILALLGEFFSAPVSKDAGTAFIADYVMALIRKEIGVVPLAAALIAASIYAFLSAKRGLILRASLILAAFLSLSFAVGGGLIQPTIAAVTSPKSFMEAVSQKVPSGASLLQYRENFYPALFYAASNLPVVENLTQLQSPARSEVFLIAKKADLPRILQVSATARIVLESSGPAAEGKDWLVLVRLPVA